MSQKSIIWLCMFLGSSLGSALPLLWGGSLISFSSVLLGGLGGALGVWIGYKLSE